MKKSLILAVLLMFFVQPVGAKAHYDYNCWQYESRHWWNRTVKVSPDRAGAKYVHDYMDEHPNIYEAIDLVVLRDWKGSRVGYIHKEEYRPYAEKIFPNQCGKMYYRASIYMRKIAEYAKELGDNNDSYISYIKTINQEKEDCARLNRKDILDDKIIVLPQAIDARKWIIGDVLINEQSFVFEYIPEDGPRIHKANEIFSIEFVNNTFAKDLDEYKYKFRRYNEIFKDDLNLKYEDMELSKSKDGFTWYWGFGEDNENVVMSVKQVKDGYFRVAYTRHNPISKEDIVKWQKIVEERINHLE